MLDLYQPEPERPQVDIGKRTDQLTTEMGERRGCESCTEV